MNIHSVVNMLTVVAVTGQRLRNRTKVVYEVPVPQPEEQEEEKDSQKDDIDNEPEFVASSGEFLFYIWISVDEFYR